MSVVICASAQEFFQHDKSVVEKVYPGARCIGIPVGTVISYIPWMILNQLKSEETISRLILAAHGNAGKVYLSGEDKSPLSSDNVHVFEPLKKRFDPYTRMITLHSCGVASDEPYDQKTGEGIWSGSGSGDGYQFMKKLANATGAPVHAGRDVQTIFWGGKYLQGPTVWVYPDLPMVDPKTGEPLGGGWATIPKVTLEELRK